MNRTSSRIFLAVAAVAFCAQHAMATAINTGVSLPNGSFATTLGGTGTAHLTGASGNYRTWTSLGFTWLSTNTGISASNQTVPISMPNVNIANNVASGSANIGYDDLAPGTPMSVNSLNADLNGAGGANQNTNFTINANPLSIQIGGLGSANLALTVNGMITDATFSSTGGSPANSYIVPGNLNLTIQGTVSGTLVNILGISGFNLGLGTLFSLPSTTLTIATALPGNMLLTDLSGGLGPYPANMGVDLSAVLAMNFTFPVVLPFSTSQTFPQVGHNNQFTSLTINPGSELDANLTLGNPSYDLNGTVPLALVPEPSGIVLSLMALVGLAFWRRRRKAA